MTSLALVLLVLNGVASLHADDGDRFRGRRVIDVLEELQEDGLNLIYSSAVIGKKLRVGVEPTGTEPLAILEQILRSLDLQAKEGPSGSILILPLGGDHGKLIGRVLSLTGGRPIVGATVTLMETGDRVTADSDGRFELVDLSAETYSVHVEAVGFVPATLTRVRVTSESEATLTIELEAQPMLVTEVVVTPSRHVVRQEQAARHVVTAEDAVLAPTIGGDVTRLVELLPGVAAADNSAAFNVRGSVARDVSMVLDGMELYDPFHLQSFQSPFSLIDANVVDRVDFFGGGYTADLGDRHGGFVEIQTLGPSYSTQSEIELGTQNSRVTYRSPMSRGTGAWLISARGWYPEAVVDTTELGAGEKLDPRFGDVYAKAAFNPSARHRLSLHGLVSYDRLTFTETAEIVNERVNALTRNAYGWLRLRSAWATGLTSETMLSGGRIERMRDGISAEDGALVVNDDRTVDFFGLKHDSVWEISPAHAIKAGADLRWLTADYRYSIDVEDDPAASTMTGLDPHGTSGGAYLAHRARLAPTLTTELGLRWDRQTYTNDNQLSPRFNAVWRPAERSELRLALGRFHQSERIHELHVEDGETEYSRAEVAEQVELSLQHGFRSGIRARLDLYYRELSDLAPRYENLFEPIELFPETTGDRVKIEPDEARLQGLELFVRGDSSRPFFWWASYVLSSADDVIDGRNTPRNWDQTHAGRVLIGYRRDERWSVSLSGSVHTGWPTTPVLAEAETLPDGSIQYEAVPGERNTDRFDTYTRFDFKGRRSIPLSRGRLWLTLEIINLTDRDNPCCLNEVFFDPQPDGSADTTRVFDHWLGIKPSFSVLWEF